MSDANTSALDAFAFHEAPDDLVQQVEQMRKNGSGVGVAGIVGLFIPIILLIAVVFSVVVMVRRRKLETDDLMKRALAYMKGLKREDLKKYAKEKRSYRSIFCGYYVARWNEALPPVILMAFVLFTALACFMLLR